MKKHITQLQAGVIGTGFIGPVHIEAIRRIGAEVVAICGSDSATEVAHKWNIPNVFTNYNYRGLIDSEEVDVVHITSPNKQHYTQAMQALQAGKHVVCEKPLSMNSKESAVLVEESAKRPRQIFAVNYNVRFYPAVLQMRADIAAGKLGEIIHVNGSYFQDWLLFQTDYNWRLLAEEGGDLRAVGDIGTHWMDTVSFILGSKVESLFASLRTKHKTRLRPVGEMKTFSKTSSTQKYKSYPVKTEDFANILLNFRNGCAGNLGVSQVAAGRKNSIRIEIYGTKGSVWWDSEEPNVLHYGNRGEPNQTSHRACPTFSEDIAGYTDYPPGHAEGFPDTFKMLYRAVYADIANGKKTKKPLYATAQDGHDEMLLCEAILTSHRESRLVKV